MKKFSIVIIIALVLTLVVAAKPTPVYACECLGTGTPGYWKNHPEVWSEVWVAGEYWSQEEVMPWLTSAVKGDKTITMFKAVVAAQLNYVDASCACDGIRSTLGAAQGWLWHHPVGSGVTGSSAAWKAGEPLYKALDMYNNGLYPGCPPHRD